MEIRLNGKTIYHFVYGGLDVKETLLPKLFSAVPNLQFWSEDALRKLFVGTIELTLEFLHEVDTVITEDLRIKSKHWHQRDTAKTLKRKARNLGRRLQSQLKVVPFLDREGLLKQIYNLVLICDGLDTLRNFGLSNQFGDKVAGNPEKQLLRKKI